MQSQESALVDAGYSAFRERRWVEAHESFRRADEAGLLSPSDLEAKSTAAYMIGDVPGMIGSLERAHRGYVEADDKLAAAKSALWLGTNLASRGKMAQASGWIEKASRLLESFQDTTVAHGYLLLPQMFRHEAKGDFEGVANVAASAAAIGRRFLDPDLVALAAHSEGKALLRQGRSEEGLRLLDEVMVGVIADELSPMVTGLVYCSVIDGCYQSMEIPRAAEWTEALTVWCGDQPDLVAFNDQCLAHRAEILTLRGQWDEALTEAERALDAGARGPIAAQAHYQRAEVYRMRQDTDSAVMAYQEVSSAGGDPMPGLAMLRLQQGDTQAAAASIERVIAETNDLLMLLKLLPVHVEVMIATGSVGQARASAERLADIGSTTDMVFHRAAASTALGLISLAVNEPETALTSLRTALGHWRELGIPYAESRVRQELAEAMRLLGDIDGADLELEAASSILRDLGVLTLALDTDSISHGLTDRELQVLRMVTTGATNRSIAEELVLSERTVDRHVSNIFTKIGVSTRTAAASFAHRNDMI